MYRMSVKLELWNTNPFTLSRVVKDNDTIVLQNNTFVANVPSDTESVEFYVNNNLQRTEKNAPLTISGDQTKTATPFTISAGKHTFKVIVHSKKGTTQTLECSINIVSSQAQPPREDEKNQPNAKKVIYSETYNSSVADVLRRGKYWVFVWGAPSVTSYTHPEVSKRITISNGTLKQVCFASDKDYSGKNLNPRTELRLEGIRLPFEKTYRVEMMMNGIAKNTFNFEFFQIMESYPKAGPVFQLDFHGGKYNARYYDSTNGQLWRKPIVDFGVGECRWVVEWRQSSDTNKCFITVFLNGKSVWERKNARNTRQGSGSAWLQYGVYKAGNNNQDMYLEVHQFTVSEI